MSFSVKLGGQLQVMVLKGYPLWKHPCIVCVCPLALVGELDLLECAGSYYLLGRGA